MQRWNAASKSCYDWQQIDNCGCISADAARKGIRGYKNTGLNTVTTIEQIVDCPMCGTSVVEGEDFCRNCGETFLGPPPPPPGLRRTLLVVLKIIAAQVLVLSIVAAFAGVVIGAVMLLVSLAV